MERRIRLGELLLRAGLISELQLKAALAEQKKWGGRLGRILVDMSFITEDILVKGLSRLLEVPRADFSKWSVPDEIMRRFDPTDCQNRGYLPLFYSAPDKKLTLAMVDVNDLSLIDELRFKYSFNFEPVIAGEHALLEKARSIFYGESISADAAAAEGGMKLVDNLGGSVVESPAATAAQVAQAAQARQTAQASVGPPPPAAPGAGGELDLMSQLAEVEAGQRRQARAIKTVVELLIQKGVFSREQFMAAVNRRQE